MSVTFLDNNDKIELEIKIEEKIGKDKIKQTTGDSELDVMSQKVVTEELNKRSEDIAGLKSDIGATKLSIEGECDIALNFEQGAYFTNGFSNSNSRIRAEIGAGKYCFTPSSSIFFSVVYYDSDSAGTQVVGMGSIVSKREITISRKAYVTIQYRDASAITPKDSDELSIQLYAGEPLKNLPYLMSNRIAEVKNKGNAKDYDHVVGRTAYYVGAEKTHTTINGALAAWANDGYPSANVYVSNGEYNEVVDIDGKDISLIGESKDGTIIRTTNGQYVDSPLHIKHGNVTIQNMTIIADHGIGFNYEADASPSCAYGIHIDGGTVAGKVLVKNCKIVSCQSPALGLGTIPNSIIRIEDCEVYSYTALTNASSTKQYRALHYGCLLCHMSSSTVYPTRGTETLELVNNKFFAKNTRNVIKLNYGDVLSEHLNVLAINNVLCSNAENDKNVLFVPDSGLVTLNSQSQGNTCNTMNAV